LRTTSTLRIPGARWSGWRHTCLRCLRRIPQILLYLTMPGRSRRLMSNSRSMRLNEAEAGRRRPKARPRAFARNALSSSLRTRRRCKPAVVEERGVTVVVKSSREADEPGGHGEGGTRSCGGRSADTARARQPAPGSAPAAQAFSKKRGPRCSVAARDAWRGAGSTLHRP
jgi:hypothetical protein